MLARDDEQAHGLTPLLLHEPAVFGGRLDRRPTARSHEYGQRPTRDGGGSTATRRRCARRWASPPSRSRIAGLQHHVAVEAATVRSAFACRNLVGTKVLVGKFDEDLEKDRNEVVALKLTSSAARDDGLNRRNALLAAERLARGVEDDRGLATGSRRRHRCLCEGHNPCQKSQRKDDDSPLHLNFTYWPTSVGTTWRNTSLKTGDQ